MKKALLTLVQICLTLGLLWLVFRDPHKRQALSDAIHQSNWKWLAFGIGAYGLFEVLAGIRWQMLLRVQGIHISWLRLYGLLMVGLFFSLFIPGGTGGDLVKAYYLAKETPDGKKTAAVLSVLMDRLMGLLGVAVITGVVTWWRWDWLTSDLTSRGFVITGLIVLGASLFGVCIAGIIAAFHIAKKLPAHFPFRAGLVKLSTAFNLYGRAWGTTTAALLISIVAHGAHYTTFWGATKAIELTGPRKPNALELYSVLPIIETVAALPITPGGLGTREKLFDEMLTTLTKPNLEEGVAPSISMLGYACIVFWGLVGGLFYLFYRPSSRGERQAMMTKTALKEEEIVE